MEPGFSDVMPLLPHGKTGMSHATLYVCMTCKAGQPVPEGALPPGAQLHAALKAAGAPDGVSIVPVECLSACSQGCSVALSKPGAWGYVYGRLSPENAAEILDGAARYAASENGLVPWRERPEIFRKQSIARIPPLGATAPLLTPNAFKVSA
jgi:predicted metal-binding protein